MQTLKLDRSFVQDISQSSSESLALVTTMISLAHSLKMSVIAEGVETEYQLEMLRKHHCQEFQGYLFSPPVLPEEFAAILIENRQEQGAVKNSHISYPERKHQHGNEVDFADENIKILDLAFKRTKEIYTLSTREMDVFQLIVKGLSNKEISDQLFISEHTVKNHITRIFQKLEVNDRLQAMAKVYQTCIEEGKNIRAQ